MKLLHILKSAVLCSALCNCLNAQLPKAPSQPVTETFFGKEVTDPYRNLENLSDSNVMNWYKAQAAYSEGQLNKLPLRETIYNELRNLDEKLKYQITMAPRLFPSYRGDEIFYIKTFAGEQSGKLYCKRAGSANEILIFDPNKNNQHETSNVISGFSVNDDGSKVSVVVIRQGNEIGHLFIVDTKSKKQIDSVERVTEPAEWINNDAFIYTQYHSADVLNTRFRLNREAKKHVVGTNSVNDAIILSHENNPDIVSDSATYPNVYIPYRNAKYIVGRLRTVDPFNDVFLAKINSKEIDSLHWYPFIRREDKVRHYFIQGDKAFGLCMKENKKGRILMTSAKNPDWDHAKIIAEATQGAISSLNPFTLTENYLYYVESYGVEQKIYQVRLSDLQKQEIKLPLSGNVVPSSLSPVESHVRMISISWISPTIIYDFDEKKKSIRKPGFWVTPQIEGLDKLEVEVAYAVSYDGTKVPLTIIKPKGLKKDGSHTVILNGYGNYGRIQPPLFDPSIFVMAKHDIMFAVAHVRGGGELGTEWRMGGFKSTKPNTWKDAIACAEYLIKEGYTQPSKLAIMGMSAGGILAGRAMTERPDLFAVAVPQVGVLNTLRFEFTPNGPNHIAEFGTIKNEQDFNNLYKMDSYMNIKDGVNYPATLITGALNDTRVILWQPGKFAARLQQATASGKPVWFRIDMHGGHGVAETKDQEIRQTADILAFVLSQTKGGKQNKEKKAF